VKWSWVTIREYLFYLLIFSLPWQTRWIIRDPYLGGEVWEYGRISLYGWDILLVILVVINLPLLWQTIKNVKTQSADWRTKFKVDCHCEESRQAGRRGNLMAQFTRLLRFTRNDFFIIFLLLLLLSLTSILWSGDRLLAMVWSLRLLEGGLLWLLFLAIKPKLKYIFVSLVAAGVIQALWGIWQFLSQSTFANKWLGVAIHPLTQGGTSVVLTEAGRWLRAYAGQVHPNVLGGLLIVTCLVTVWLYFNRHREEGGKTDRRGDLWRLLRFARNDSFFLWLYIIQLVGLFFTFSRGAWLALFLTLGLWWWNNKRSVIARSEATTQSHQIATPLPPIEGSARNDSLGVIVIVTIFVFIILGSIYWQPTMGRIFGGSKLEQQSIEDRAGSVKESSSLLEQVWWKGTGMGNYTYVLSQHNPGLKAWYYQPVHNIFLLVLTELGVIGLLLFLWLLWVRLKIKPFLIHNSLFIIPIIIISLFDHYWWTVPSMFLLFWLIMAVGNPQKTNTP